MAVMLLCLTNKAVADEQSLKSGEREFNTTIATTHQSADPNTIASENLYSLDLTYTQQFDGFGVHGWAEYSKSTKANGVSAILEYANADAGTTTVSNGQISELYLFGGVDNTGDPSWRFGINEVTTLVDRSDLANDEIEQFLSLGLVNNLTIAFPDYALSGFYQDLDVFDEFGYRWVVSSSHGLADNEGGSYTELVDVDDSNKGFFSAFEWVFDSKDYQANLGYWKNSGAGEDGFYSGLDYFAETGKLNIRYGVADVLPDNPEQFASAAWQQPIYGGQLALGYTFTRFNRLSNSVLRQAELYYRRSITELLYLTPSLQWFSGANINGANTNNDTSDQWLLTLRTELSF